MPNDHVTEALAILRARDAEYGARAEARVRAIYGDDTSLDSYDFAHSSQRDEQITQRTDWVHQGWLRPLRFVYRHLPKPLKFAARRIAR